MAMTATYSAAKPTGPTGRMPHTPEDLRREPAYPLWVNLRNGDQGARDRLILQYAPLVKYVIGRMAISLPAAMDSDDVLSAGTIGLMHAVDRFDPDQGVRFETYALQRIRGAIIDTIRSLSPLSRGAGRRAKQLEEAAARLAQQLGRVPSQEELATDLGIDLHELSRMMQEAAHVIVYLDHSNSFPDEDGETQSLGDVLGDPQQLAVEAVAEENEQVDRLAAAIDQLPERDRLTLSLYYQEELTLKEISYVLGVSESRVSQIHTAAVIKLRALLRHAGVTAATLP